MDTTTQAAPTIPERVQAGAALLDKHRPGWLDRADVITLDVEDPECCPLGQEFGDYNAGLCALKLTGDEPEAYGFYVTSVAARKLRPIGEVKAEYAALTEAWKTYVLTEGARS